jgi:mono/diheme cytochrome c family protein
MIKVPRTFAFALIGLFSASSAAFADQDAILAQRVSEVLKTNCYRCHGENGANEGGLNFILRLDKLRAQSKYVVPGQPDQSNLYRRVANQSMPPSGEIPRPTLADAALLKQWIEAGAPQAQAPTARQTIFPAAMVETICNDLQRINERDRVFARYFTITHLYNAGLWDNELLSYQYGLSKLVNSLSWGKKVVRPEPVDAAKTIFRIDLRDYQWTDKTWDDIIAQYPYGVQYDTPASRYCCEASKCKLPFVRADWFVAAASVPPLYHRLLELPETDRELEKQLRVPVENNIGQNTAVRAAFNGSGVSQNNRLIERHESPFGAYWKSYDFAHNDDKGNLFSHPLGPGAFSNAFRQDGGEIIFNLPNGLQAYLIVDGKGKRLDRAPTAIVSDSKRPDRAVVTGLSCMSCHTKGIIPKGDQIREFVEKNPKAFTKAEIDSIQAMYVPATDFEKLQSQDAERFRDAVDQTGARLARTEPVLALALQHESPLDLIMAAAEIGISTDILLKGLDGSAALARLLGQLKLAGNTVQRQALVEAFPIVVRELKLGRWLPMTVSKAAPAVVSRPNDTSTPMPNPAPKSSRPSSRPPASTNVAPPSAKVKADSDLAPVAEFDLKATLSDLIVSKNRKWVYVLNTSEAKIQRINTEKLDLDMTAATLTEGVEKMRMNPAGDHLFICASPNGHDHQNGNKGGKFQVINPETLEVTHTVNVGFSIWDFAPDDKGILYATMGGGQHTHIHTVNSKAKTSTAELPPLIWERAIVRLTPSQQLLYFADTEISPNTMHFLNISGNFPIGFNSLVRTRVPAQGRFEISPDGKFLICLGGQILRTAGSTITDLKSVAAIDVHISIALDKEAKIFFVATKDKVLKVFSYPDFELKHTLAINGQAYRMALDAKGGKLYCAMTQGKVDPPFGVGLGSLQVYDVKDLLDEAEAKAPPKKPAK